jgi:hypothetical protein
MLLTAPNSNSSSSTPLSLSQLCDKNFVLRQINHARDLLSLTENSLKSVPSSICARTAAFIQLETIEIGLRNFEALIALKFRKIKNGELPCSLNMRVSLYANYRATSIVNKLLFDKINRLKFKIKYSIIISFILSASRGSSTPSTGESGPEGARLDEIKSIVHRTRVTVWEYLGKVSETVWTTTEGAVDATVGVAGNILERVWTTTEGAVDATVGVAGKVSETVWTTTEGAVDATVGVAGKVSETVWTTTEGAVDATVGVAGNILERVWTTTEGAIDATVSGAFGAYMDAGRSLMSFVEDRNYQVANKSICEKISRSIQSYKKSHQRYRNAHHWLTHFFDHMGITIDFFYTQSQISFEGTFGQKNSMLLCIQKIIQAEEKETDLNSKTVLIFFPILLKNIFTKFQFSKHLKQVEIALVLHNFKRETEQLMTVWSFIATLDRSDRNKYLLKLFQSCPPFLQFFILAVGTTSLSEEGRKITVMRDLREIAGLLGTSHNFYVDFTSGNLNEDIKSLNLSLSTMVECFNGLIFLSEQRYLPPKWNGEAGLTKRLEELTAFLTKQKTGDSGVKNFLEFYKRTQLEGAKTKKPQGERYRIYDIKIVLAGLEAFYEGFFLVRVKEKRLTEKNWDTALAFLWEKNGVMDEGQEARKELSALCFKIHIQHVLNMAGAENSKSLADELYKQLAYIPEFLNDDKLNKQEGQRERILRNVTIFINSLVNLMQAKALPKDIFYWLSVFLSQNPKETFKEEWRLSEALDLITKQTHPTIREISERLRTGKPLSSLPGAKKPVNVHKISLNLTNNPYLLISHVVPCFVQALLPKISHQEMHDFKAVLRLCEAPFMRSPLKSKLQEIITPLISDPFVLGLLRTSNPFGVVKECFQEIKDESYLFFTPIAKGEAKLGDSLTEREISELIDEILKIREVKKDSSKLSERQKAIMEAMPVLADTIEDVNTVIGLMTGLLSFKVGPLNLGASVLQGLGGFATRLGSGVYSFISFLPSTDSNSSKTNETSTAEEKSIWDIPNYLRNDAQLSAGEADAIFSAVSSHVVPIVNKLTPIIFKNHALKAYVDIFKQLDGIIKSEKTSPEVIEEERQKATQLIATLIAQVPRELDPYMNALAAVYDGLINLEHHEAPLPAITTTTMTTTTTLTTTISPAYFSSL